MPMTTVLRRLPFFETPTTASVRNERLTIKPYQIIVWVSVAAGDQEELQPNTPRFPAVLDIGLSYNFAIGEDLLRRWAGLHPQWLLVLGRARLSGLPADLLDAEVWLFPNQPRQRDRFCNLPPFRLNLDGGIAVYPRQTPNAPRLPLLGLRGLRWTNLQLALDCQACHVSLRTPRRFWIFG
jgi:hypothetical protein